VTAETTNNPAQDGAQFTGNLAAPPPIPDSGRDAADRLMRQGLLFRYAETGSGAPEAALLEEEFAAYMGASYCVAVNSCGGSLFLALRGAGVGPGDRVLVNAFTLAPAPGAVAHAGAEPVLVDITEDLTIDLDDLVAKARASGARHLLLSHMRGHVSDLDAVADICAAEGLTLIEDCAHTTGARWNGKLTGRFGLAGCFSAQSYKHLNGGEGGLVVTDDPDLAARITLMSGSYMLYAQHRARPDLEVFERWRLEMPNFSMRMNGLAAAVLRPQLAELDARVARWRAIHARVAARLARAQNIRLPVTPEAAYLAPTSIQFTLQGMDEAGIARVIERAAARGVAVKWFGAEAPVGFTSRPDHWRYIPAAATPPRAADILARLCDVRLPVELSDADCDLIGEIVAEAASRGI
jgi:dTDP-4-amino-4,6-dideoxygalactose transaminase